MMTFIFSKNPKFEMVDKVQKKGIEKKTKKSKIKVDF